MMNNLSFSDEAIEKMEFLADRKILRIFLEGAVLYKEKRRLEKGILTFTDGMKISVSRFDKHGKNPLVLDPGFEFVEEMDMFTIEENCVTFGGFGTEIGHWVEWTITGASYIAEFDAYDESFIRP